jgi:LysM repeat protein
MDMAPTVREFPAAFAWVLGRLPLVCLLFAALAGQALPAMAETASPPVITHQVRPGETLYSLSRRYAVPVAAIMAANGIAAPEKLAAGARLRIPAGSQRVAGEPGADGAPPPADWKSPDRKNGVMGVSGKSETRADRSFATIPLKNGATLSPEYRDPGAVVMSGAADGKEDFQGHALGVKTKIPAGKDTEFISTLGYGVRATVDENSSTAIGYKTDTSIDGLGYGVGLRHSF